MEEERSGKGLWIILFVVAVLAAICFATLWHLRGGEVERLTTAITANQSAADAATTRLERELRTARTEVDAGVKKITELENRVRDEQRRATEMAQQVERRLRNDLDAANARVRDMAAQVSRLQADIAQTDDTPDEDGTAEDGTPTLETQLAQAVEEKEALETTVGELQASLDSLRQEVATATENLEAARDEAAKVPELEGRLAEARQRVETLEEQLAVFESEHGSLTQDLSATSLSLEKARADAVQAALLAGELEAAKKTIDDLRREAEGHTEQLASLRKDLAAAYADLKHTEDGQPSDVSEVESRMAALSRERDTLAKREEELTQTVATLRKELEDAKRLTEEADIESLRREATEARQETERIRSARDVALKNAAEALEDARASAANLERRVAELEADHENARKEQADAKTACEERLATERTRLAKREQELLEVFSREKAQLEKKLETAVTAVPAAPARPASEPVASTPAPAADSDALPEAPRHFPIQDPDRFVGQIRQVLPNGEYLVTGGKNQGVRPGMLFNVNRPAGSMNWFIGVLCIDRTMDNDSVGMLLPCEGVKICPVTGRAVLASDQRHSPYVLAEGDRPVPLIPAGSLGLGGETPAVGDKIDNPFFDPSRKLRFAVEKDANADSTRVTRVIEALGGETAEATDQADFIVVGAETPPTQSTPRCVTVGELESYVTIE